MSIGYADFQASPQWRDSPMVAQFGVSFPAGNTSFGPFLVGNFCSLAIVATSGLNASFVQVTFANDSALLQAPQTLTFSLSAVTSMTVVLPVLGNYVRIVYNNDGPGAATATLNVYATNQSPNGPYYQAQNVGGPLLAGSVSIGASGNALATATQLIAGPATFSVANSATNKWHALIDYWSDSASAFVQYAAFDGTNLALRFTAPITLPPAIVQAIIFNDDAAAHNFVWAIVAAP